MRRRRSQESGFTLVEVLVSLVLATIAMIGVIALYRTQTTASSFSRRTTEATVLAEDQMERLRLQSGATGGTITETTLDETGKVTATGPFTRKYSATLNGTFYDLVVEVGWTEEGSNKSVKLLGRRNVPN